ncbi:MAG: glycosyltransferase family 2 protein [Saprospiraceae bacterium]
MDHQLSVIICTHNEAARIAACLQSLRGVADEIIVVDDASTDQTVLIASSLGARVVQEPWRGFGAQKNQAAELAAHHYVLSLDADEALSPQMQQSIVLAKQKGLQGVYSLDRINKYYGKYLRHGLENPDHKARLYPKDICSWSLDKVHERLLMPDDLSIQLLEGKLLHDTYPKFSDHVQKADRYTSLAAAQYFADGKKASIAKIIFSPWAVFIKAYFLKLGLLDGLHGFILAYMHAQGTFLKYVKLWDLQRVQKELK